MQGEFAGRVAVVSGGASGIGAAVGHLLAGKGATVVLVDVDGAAAIRTAEAISAAGGTAEAFVADLTDQSVGPRLFKHIDQRYGRLDVLCNNAGIQRYGTAVETPPELWHEVMSVNVTSAYLTSRALIPLIELSGGGAVVNTACSRAVAVRPETAAYTASKAALIGLTAAMARDHIARNVRVNAVLPGSVDTPLLRSAAQASSDPGSVYADVRAEHPIGRVARPEEIAEVIAFLASPRASFVVGAAWAVDGGLSI